MRVSGWGIVFGLAAGFPGVAAAVDAHVFTGATLIDGTGAAAVHDAVLVVRGGRVACAGAVSDCEIPDGVRTTDLSGRWITPGLVDAHVHLAQTGWADGRPDGMNVTADYPYAEVVARQRDGVATTFRSYLCSGVTAVFDVGGFPWSWRLRDQEMDLPGSLTPPHLAASGPLLTWVPPRMDLPAEQVMVRVSSPEHGREVVRYLAASGSDAVKIWLLGVPENPPAGAPSQEEVDAWVKAVGQEARARGLPLVVHATGLQEAKTAVRAGAKLLVHSVDDGPVDDEFLELALREGTMYTPTLMVGRNWWALTEYAFRGEEPVLDDPRGCVDPATRARISTTPRYREHPGLARLDEDGVASRRRRFDQLSEVMAGNLRRVHAAGIAVAMGTDAGNPLTLHGPSVYAEMEQMQKAGLAPADVLVAATRNAARAMGRDTEFGTLEAGKWADFLVLGEDPLQDVTAFRSRSHVARAGVLVAVGELSFGR